MAESKTSRRTGARERKRTALARLEELYRQAAAAGERHEMRRIVQAEVLLLGLAKPPRLEITGSDGAPVRIALVDGERVPGDATGGQR